MKYYTASKTKHAHQWRALRSRGVEITSSWIDEAEPGQTNDFGDLCLRCLREIAEADVLVLYCEPDEILKGALVEVGVAMALNKPIRCLGDCVSLSKFIRGYSGWQDVYSIHEAFAGEVTV